MLQLLANNQPLNIGDASFNLTLKSPLSSENAGSFVYSITIPNSDYNAQIFGYPFRLTRKEVAAISIPGAIVYNGIHVQDGTWQVKSAVSKTITIEMLIGAGYFNSLVDGYNLPKYFDVSFDIYPSIIAHVDSWVTKAYPEVNHNFPCIFNPSFYGEKNEDFGGVMNDYYDGFVGDVANHTNVVPQLYLLYVIKHLYEQNGYNCFGTPLQDERLKRRLIYNNYAIDDVVANFFSATIIHDVVSSPYTCIWDTNINDPLDNYNETTGHYTLTSAGKWQIDLNLQVRLNSMPASGGIIGCVVKIYYNNVQIFYELYETATPLTYIYIQESIIEDLPQAQIDKDVHVEVYYVDIKDDKFEPYFGEYPGIKIYNTTVPNINKFGHNINYQNHVPDMDVKTFLGNFFTTYKILPFYDHTKKTVALVFLRDMLKSNKKTDLSDGLVRDSLKVYPNNYAGCTFKFDFQGPDSYIENNFNDEDETYYEVDTFDELSEGNSPGYRVYVKSLNAVYEMTFIEGETEDDPGTYEWLPYSDRIYPLVLDDGEKEITSQLAPLLMRAHVDSSGYLRNMPGIDAEGQSLGFEVSGSFPLRVFDYVGLKEGVNTGSETTSPEYPFATTVKYETDGSECLNYDYNWTDLVSRYHTEVIAWWKRRMKIEFEQIVTPEFISNLNLQDKFYFQKTLVLFEKVVVKIKSKLFGPGKMTGWG